jgi:predicted alpha-1,2-mannosidase
VLHDIHGLIDLFGSVENIDSKLDQLFTESSEIDGDDVSPDISGLIGQYAHGNEPSHHIAYIYNFLGKAWKTQKMVNKILTEQYSNTPCGIAGNEDMGQMSAWYVMSSIGLYPFSPVDGNLLLTSPLFQEVEIQLSNGKSFKILSKNHSSDNIYIQSAKLNGKDLNKSYISYKELMQGGILQLTLDSIPNKNWAADENSLPPRIH